MIHINDYEILKDHILSLKQLSIDDSDRENINYMTNSEITAVDFDAVKTQYANELGLSEEAANSVDALYYESTYMALIEFKNGKMKSEKKVKDKIRDSLLIFCDITSQQITDLRDVMDFILVYNLDKNPLANQMDKQCEHQTSKIKIREYFTQKGGKEFIRFGLERFKGLYFRDVHTYSVESFHNYLEERKYTYGSCAM